MRMKNVVRIIGILLLVSFAGISDYNMAYFWAYLCFFLLGFIICAIIAKELKSIEIWLLTLGIDIRDKEDKNVERSNNKKSRK